MSMPGSWDLEERVEDALVAYIKNECPMECMVIAARTIIKAEYPLVAVMAEESFNHTDTGNFTGRRVIMVEVAIITEAMNYKTASGLLTARQEHRQFKESVIGALAGKTVHEDLNNLGEEGVKFSSCQMEDQTRDAGDGKILTMQELMVIAQPVEID